MVRLLRILGPWLELLRKSLPTALERFGRKHSAAGSIPAASIPRNPAISGDRFFGSTQPLPKAAGSPSLASTLPT
jgi:hypothetical protein